MTTILPNYTDLLAALQKITPSAHIAGGAVRDSILGKPELEREATKILAADRRRRRRAGAPKRPKPAPAPSRNGWREFADLRRIWNSKS